MLILKNLIAAFLIILAIQSCIFIPGSPKTQGNLPLDAKANAVYFDNPLPIQLIVDSIEDIRPIMETVDSSRNSMKMAYYIPGLILFSQARLGGPVYGAPNYYTESIESDLKTLFSEAIQECNFASKQGSKYKLNVKILHYYGVSYTSLYWTLPRSITIQLFPTGFVMLKLTITDDKNTLISEKIISSSFLFNPEDENTALTHDAYGIKGLEDAKIFVAAAALKKLMHQIPYTLDQMLAENLPERNIDTIRSFTILRNTSDYNYNELIKIDFETGTILSDTIVSRQFPIISKANEWVVAPIGNDGHWLNSIKYKGFIERLRFKYPKIEFGSNLNVALFHSK